MRFQRGRLPSTIYLILVALVAGQVLGLVHGVVHMQMGWESHAGHHEASTSDARDRTAGVHWTASLFDHHADGSGECLVVGHGLFKDAATVSAAILLHAPVLTRLAFLAPPVPEFARPAHFSARAPPALG